MWNCRTNFKYVISCATLSAVLLSRLFRNCTDDFKDVSSVQLCHASDTFLLTHRCIDSSAFRALLRRCVSVLWDASGYGRIQTHTHTYVRAKHFLLFFFHSLGSRMSEHEKIAIICSCILDVVIAVDEKITKCDVFSYEDYCIIVLPSSVHSSLERSLFMDF